LANEFFLFAGIMGAAGILFTFMTLPYKYVETNEEKKKREAEEQGMNRMNDSISTISIQQQRL